MLTLAFGYNWVDFLGRCSWCTDFSVIPVFFNRVSELFQAGREGGLVTSHVEALKVIGLKL